jgi:DUF4097 and DUF4098 domain-containing protein YvlB/uncharacterized membrane protein
MQRDAYRAQFRRYSRSSLVGPLLLIGAGIVALLLTLHRMNAGLFWQWYAHWWPLVLIGAGLILAVESLAASGPTRVRLGGGVVLLGIFLAFLGIVVAHTHANWSSMGKQLDFGSGVNLPQMFGNRHEASEQIQHQLPANATVVLQNPYGDVSVTSGDNASNADQLQLTLNKVIYTGTDAQAAPKLQALEPLITASGSTVVVHVPSNQTAAANLAMLLPVKANLQIQAGHGDVSIAGREAAVEANAEYGDMALHGIAGPVHATMHQGDFSASNIQGNLNLNGRMDDVSISQVGGAASLNGDFFGDVHLTKVHGPVHLHSSRTDCQMAELSGSVSLDGDNLSVDTAKGPLTIATHAKDISLRNVTGDVRVKNSDGDVSVTAIQPLGSINIENHNGSVDLTLPNDAQFSIQANAGYGEIHSDFDLKTQNGDEYSTISGSVGTGGPMIRIVADKGDITLHKSE